ncbi:MAG TPA: galactokinase [Caldilineaceae bacterium]|mgnify:CR=1 FL=1|nr:galactokinase [Caldilineaceae bacterium]
MQPIDKRTEEIQAEFAKVFDGSPTHVAIAPGRVNLIGEHTDYNDGFVLPVALDRDVRVIFRPRNDRRVRLYALEFDTWADFDLDALAFDEEVFWANYTMGVAWALEEAGVKLRGLEGVVSGNIPRGSGLSSSAGLEISNALALLAAAGKSEALTGPQIAQAAQRAENHFVGVNCGIMDQFISTLGEEGYALLIDCRSLDYQRVPFPDGASLVIGNTKASRSLANSAYNERRAQCEEGVARLQSALPEITALRDVTSAQLEAHKGLLSPIVYRRCRHVVGENERVMGTVAALAAGDLEEVGRLMNASHESLRDDYEVSSEALDAMVAAMRSALGCLGARLTGAGFGGCAVALVRKGQERAVRDAIFENYSKSMNIWPEVYTPPASAGARLFSLE